MLGTCTPEASCSSAAPLAYLETFLSAGISHPIPAVLPLQELNGKPMAIGETEHSEFRSLHPGPPLGPGAVCDPPQIIHIMALQFTPTALQGVELIAVFFLPKGNKTKLLPVYYFS